MLNDTLPGIGEIKLYTVEDLVSEIETLDPSNLNPSSMSFHTCLYICDLISKSPKFKTLEYSEYKELEPSGYYLGSMPVSKGAFAIYSVACEAGLLLLKDNNGVTAFEFKKILDSLDSSDSVGGKIGAYLRRFIEESIVKKYQKSGQVQISERLFARFKKELKNGPFISSGLNFSIKEEKYCEPFFQTDIYAKVKDFQNPEDKFKKIVNNMPLWYGTNNVMETKAIKQLLIDVACALDEVNLSNLFIVVKEKVKDWLVNSPLSIEYNSEQSGDTHSNLKNVLKSDNFFDNSLNYLILEDSAKKIIEKFTQDEIYLLKLKFIDNKSDEAIGSIVGKARRTVSDAVKKLTNKLEKEFMKLIKENENDFDLEELTSTFMNEVEYMRLEPPKL